MTTSTNHSDRFRDLASKALTASRLADGEVPPAAVDAYGDAQEAVLAITSAAMQLEEKKADLAKKRDLLPKEGAARLRREANQEAQAVAGEATQAFTKAMGQVEDALLQSALPTLKSDNREALARQELEVALGDAQGADAASRLLGVAKSGSAEAQAVLGTPFARTALIARSVPNVDEKLRSARTVVAETSGSPEAVSAREGLEKVQNLRASCQAMNASLRWTVEG